MLQVSSILNNVDQKVDAKVERAYRVLLEHARRNLPSVNDALIRRAFLVAYWAHRNDRRASGEPYILHPVEVATIVARDIGLDDVSVAAALLHDVVEDTEITLDLIREDFGDTVATIIDGLTKISDVFKNREMGRAENVRKLMLSMASDLRVILIKFADRLHNMRTLDSLRPEKQAKIASDTLDLYAPLAHRFGLNTIKVELEDLSLKVLDPKAYTDIAKGLRAKRRQRQKFIEGFILPLQEQLKAEGIECHIYGRPKHIYSIYRKMQRQDKTLEEIYDLLAVRIILTSTGRQGKADCWRVYSIITDQYAPIPERFRDFISVAKSNGYQSLHTTVIGPDGRRIEVQIRTEKMHAIAERGVAAHWKYKEGETGRTQQMDAWYAWARDLLENPNPDRAAEFVKEFRLNLYDEEIYVFTPKGDLMTLPRGATPVDFAFQVHTEVGFHCIGAKVNGKMVPLSHELQVGDQVEVLTSKKQTPHPHWMKFVVTHKARSRVRHWINEKERKATQHGREVWEKKMKKAKLGPFDDTDLNRIAARLRFTNPQQMFHQIGVGQLDVEDVMRVVQAPPPAEPGAEGTVADQAKLFDSFLGTAQETGRPSLIIDGEKHTDIATKYAPCCNPVPGDQVFGYISREGAINIHRMQCTNAANLLLNQNERVVPLEWSQTKDASFVSALRIVGEDRVGLINDLTTVISRNLKTNIRSINVDTEDGVFEGTMVLYVSDLEHLQRLMDRIKRLEGVHGVYRFEE